MSAEPTFLARRDRPTVLYVIQAEEFSGAELVALPILEADVDPLVACPPRSPTAELLARRSVPTTPLAFRPLRHSAGLGETLRSAFRGLAAAYALRRIMRDQPDREIVLCTSLRPALLAALASVGLRRRLVWVLADFMPPAPLAQLARVLARVRCSRAIANSCATARDFARGSRRLRARVSVVHPGTALGPGPGQTPQPGRPHAAIVGPVTGRKRVALALEIAAQVADQEPDFRLAVVGRAQFRRADIAHERELQRRTAADPRLRDRVEWVGYTPDVAGQLARAGLLLHCCDDEPFGVALIEAMAMGLPVVAPRAGGPAEIVQDGVTGLLFAPGDADDAARQVIRLLRDRREASQLGEAGADRARRCFSTGAQLAATDRLLAELLG